MKILIADAFDKSLPAKLAKYGEVFEDAARLPEADIVLIRSKTKCTKEYIDGAPNLKMIIRGGVGLDNVDAEYAKSKNIKVFNTPEASSVAVAELAMGFLVAIPNKLFQGHLTMSKGEWAKKDLKRTELFEKTLGLIGIGRIAQEVAKRAAAFGMKVIAYDKYVSTSKLAKMVTFDELLAQSDFISLHVPSTPETSKMINADAIAKMKKGVIIVNTGRGKCIDEDALATALKNGKVAGYGTDVYYSDPPDWATCPLLKPDVPNMFMTPHIGASSVENLLRIGITVEKLIADFAKEK